MSRSLWLCIQYRIICGWRFDREAVDVRSDICVATRLVIVGLPGSGKTTVFNALTRAEAKTGGFGGGGDEPNLATVKVPDPRLDLLTEMFKPERKVQADVQYFDVAGIAKGIAEKGMSGALLNHLSQAEALIHVVRAFEDDDLPHPDGSVDPFRDIETINLEFAFSDLAIIEKRLQRLEAQIPKMRGAEKEAYEREQVVLTGLKEALESDRPLRDVVPALDPDDRKLLSGFGLLSAKPLLILLNTGESQLGAPTETLVAETRERFAGENVAVDALSGQIEMEIGRLDEESAEVFMSDLGIEESSLGRIIRVSFDLLGLMPFFTVGPDECRAWTVERGIAAVEAAGAIHSDIQRGFIRAEVVGYDDMIAAGTMAQAKALGTFRREGKTYIVQNGDIINFLFNV